MHAQLGLRIGINTGLKPLLSQQTFHIDQSYSLPIPINTETTLNMSSSSMQRLFASFFLPICWHLPVDADKKPENVARGLKAAIHNDNVSEEAKENAAQRLEEMGVEVPADFSAGQDKEYVQKDEYADDDTNDDYAEDDSVDNNEGKLDGNRRRGTALQHIFYKILT